MGNQLYSKPATENIVPAATAAAVKEEVAEKQIAYAEQNVPTIITVSEMVNSKTSVVTDVFKEAIHRYTKILSGELAVPDTQYREEQLSFMRTVSNSMDLSFKDYALVTDFLVFEIRDNKKAYDDIRLFSLLYSLTASDMSASAKDRYKCYMSALVTLSQNLTQRNRIGQLVDVATLTKGYKESVAQNIQTYFSRNYG